MSDIEWTLQPLAIRLLKDNPKNPRQIDKTVIDKLGAFIERFGLIDKPIVNQDNVIIGGHQRIRLLKKKKVKTVDCWVPNRMLGEKELDELCVGLNLHQGKWEWDALANNFDVIDLLEWGFSEEQLLGHSDDEEEIGEEEEKQEKNKKKHTCPNCSFEF